MKTSMKLDWRLAVAVAFVTFFMLTRASGDGVDVQPVWALLGGFAAALAFLLFWRTDAPSGR